MQHHLVRGILAAWVVLLLWPTAGISAQISSDTQTCLGCHRMFTPGLVADWEKSRHSHVTPAMGLDKPQQQRRISISSVPQDYENIVVGCAECHTMRAEEHPGSFDHNGYRVHTVVSPRDCAVCHQQEVDQYKGNLMAKAHDNLKNNVVYDMMVKAANGRQEYDGNKLTYHEPKQMSNADSCYACHGTKVEIAGTETRKTRIGMEMEFPKLTNWPNQGVGRINPDGSEGSCAACHMRHQFSIEVARKPYTCAQCHKGPDVPAYKVYNVSVHGNIFKSKGDTWNFDAVPWTVGKDFTAPTCATCHASEVVDDNGNVLAERTHQFNDRLEHRIFGLPYAHPHPIDADTTKIKNKAGLPLPTELTGEPVPKYLINEDTMAKRRQRMQDVCLACHSQQWVKGHFAKLNHTIETTNHMTLQATKMISQAWEEGLAQGLPQQASISDEALEYKWIEQWLFFGNSVRFATAMGGVDYGAFANGRWYQAKNLQEIHDWMKFLRAAQ